MVFDVETISTLLKEVKEAKRDVLYPSESESVLQSYGIDYPKSVCTGNDLAEVLQCVDKIGFPVALKLISPDILHKSDAGCVKLNLHNEKEIKKAYNDILKAAGKINKNEELKGFLIQEMIHSGHEVIIGLATDPTFGKIIMFGLGGIFVEILKDVAIRKIPITQLDAQDMIEEIRGHKILMGARGKEVANFPLLKELLLKVSLMSMEVGEIKELDFNPIFINSKKALVADARILI
jgi:acetyl-CoA synthetase (ADP-forming)